jgi:hypothetical protein
MWGWTPSVGRCDRLVASRLQRPVRSLGSPKTSIWSRLPNLVALPGCPENGRRRLDSVRVRTLRTQQRAKQRCQALTPVRIDVRFGTPSRTTSMGDLLRTDHPTSPLDDHGIMPKSGNTVGQLKVFHGEFDPGSGRTLAACLTHASRTMNSPSGGGLVANG